MSIILLRGVGNGFISIPCVVLWNAWKQNRRGHDELDQLLKYAKNTMADIDLMVGKCSAELKHDLEAIEKKFRHHQAIPRLTQVTDFRKSKEQIATMRTKTKTFMAKLVHEIAVDTNKSVKLLASWSKCTVSSNTVPFVR